MSENDATPCDGCPDECEVTVDEILFAKIKTSKEDPGEFDIVGIEPIVMCFFDVGEDAQLMEGWNIIKKIGNVAVEAGLFKSFGEFLILTSAIGALNLPPLPGVFDVSTVQPGEPE